MPKAASCARTRSSSSAPPHCCSTSRSCASASAWMRELKRASNSSNDVVWRAVCRAIASTMASRFLERCDSSRMISRTWASRSSRSLSCCSSTRAVVASASSVRSASGRPVFENVIARRSISACVPCSICSIGRAMRRADQIASSRLSSVVAAAGQARDQDGVADRRLEQRLVGGQSHHPSAQRRGDMGVGDRAALERQHFVPALRRPCARRRGNPSDAGRPTFCSWLRERAMKLPLRSISPASQPSGRFHCSNSGRKIAGSMTMVSAERRLALARHRHLDRDDRRLQIRRR